MCDKFTLDSLCKKREIMSLFRQDKNSNLNLIREDYFKLEKDIQDLIEQNLQKIFGLEFVQSELALNNFRIDTLAFDQESNSFVIIEYKRDKNFSVIDQGFAYLSLLLNNKADFILEYNELRDTSLKRDDVDWSQSRVLFVSTSYTNHQIASINFKDLPIELWEIKKYENGIISFNQIKADNAQESVKKITEQDETLERVRREIKVYTEEEHLELGSESIIELYEKLKSAILNLGDIELKPKKLYLAFVAGGNVVDIVIQRKALKCFLNLDRGNLDDPKKIARDVYKIGHWGNGDYEITLSNDENLEYIMSLIKQSYNTNKE